MASYENVLVTGAAGLIGSATARELLARGCKVVALDDFSNGTWDEEEPGLEWVKADVSDGSFTARVADKGIDAVVHCAHRRRSAQCPAPGGRSLREPSDYVRVNAVACMRVFEWCARSEIPVVFLSSESVYGEQPPRPIPETATFRPATPYAAIKIACEEFLEMLEASYGLQWTTLRPFSVYGPGHRPSETQGIVNVMLTQLLKGNRLVVKGSLERVRDLLYVDDAARAIVDCLFEPAARSRALNLGTGIGTSVRDMLIELCDALEPSFEDLTLKEEEGTPGDPHYNVADVQAIKSLGWSPEISVQSGIERLIKARQQAVA